MHCIRGAPLQILILSLALSDVLLSCGSAKGSCPVPFRLELRGGEKRTLPFDAHKNDTKESKRIRKKPNDEQDHEQIEKQAEIQEDDSSHSNPYQQNSPSSSAIDDSISDDDEASEALEPCPSCGKFKHENLTCDVVSTSNAFSEASILPRSSNLQDSMIPTDFLDYEMNEETKSVILARVQNNLTIDADLCEFLMKICYKRNNMRDSNFLDRRPSDELLDRRETGVAVLQQTLKMGISYNDDVYNMVLACVGRVDSLCSEPFLAIQFIGFCEQSQEWDLLIELFEEMRASGGYLKLSIFAPFFLLKGS
eukprot:764572-Hanusia_phi.AAC.3